MMSSIDHWSASMNGPDGLEERTAFYEETYERDRDDQDMREQLADELRDALVDIMTPDQR
jgi:hypothetical protein